MRTSKGSYPVNEFFVTSAPFACGVSWLVNALIKLGIKGTSLGYKSDNWVRAEEGRWKLGESAAGHMRAHLPVLAEQDTFTFDANIEFFWEHRLSYPSNPSCPVIVVVRDPRDAIFSLYRRWKANGWIQMNFREYLVRPSDWPDHFPGLYHANPIQTFALFHLGWLKNSKVRPVLFVKFEDLKIRPLESLDRILKFLGQKQYTEDLLRRAVTSSSVTSPLSDQFSIIKGAINKGEVYEWRKEYEDGCLPLFDTSAIDAALALLGYRDNIGSGKSIRELVEGRTGRLRYSFTKLKTEISDKTENNRPLSKISSRLGIPKIDSNDFSIKQDIAAFWASKWDSTHSFVYKEMRAFYYNLLDEILTDVEQEYISTRTKKSSEVWPSTEPPSQ